MKKVTLYDVAKEAEVSPKTVSRVINNEASVSPKKRKTVLDAIALLGYIPNNSARSLRNKRAYVIALLYDNLSPAYILDLQAGVMSVCEKVSYNLLVQPCNFESDSLVKLVKALLDNERVDGFILSPPISDHAGLLELLTQRQSKFVRISPINQNSVSPFVTANDRESAQQMTEHLLSLGHKQIGFITGDSNHQASSERMAGYQQALKNANIEINKHLIECGDFSFESGEQCAYNLLSTSTPPSAIFACNDYMAAGTLKTAQKLGIKVPNDLSIAGFDDAPVSKQLWPTLTTVKQPVKKIAEISTQLLLDAIQTSETKNSHIELDCQLTLRESTIEKA